MSDVDLTPGPAQFPYPHSRNDCEMCRERDADCQVDVGRHEKHGPLRLCRKCLGEWAITHLHYFGAFTVVPLDPDTRVYRSDPNMQRKG